MKIVKPKSMLVKKPAPETTDRKRPKKGLSLLVSVLFFFSLAGLYGSLGTFLSSCGTWGTRSVDVRLYYPYWPPGCYPPQATSEWVDLVYARSLGWAFVLEIKRPSLTGDNYYTYNFITTNVQGTAKIDPSDPTAIQKVEVPYDPDYPYRVRLTSMSPCGCGGFVNQRKVYIWTSPSNPYDYPTEWVTTIGTPDPPSISSCN